MKGVRSRDLRKGDIAIRTGVHRTDGSLIETQFDAAMVFMTGDITDQERAVAPHILLRQDRPSGKWKFWEMEGAHANLGTAYQWEVINRDEGEPL